MVGYLALAMTAVAPLPLAAYPNGAPWGGADPVSTQTCTSCHYGGEPTYNSSAITLYGWPGAPTPDEVYEIILRVTKMDTAVVGFLMETSAGGFELQDGASEVRESEVRSKTSLGGEVVEWIIQWHAPEGVIDNVTVDVAVNVANDDLSPLGDDIHYRSFSFDAK